MYDECEKTARALGFESIYLLPPARLYDWAEAAARAGVDEELCCDMPAAYPKASAILLAVYPYQPFERSERISAYYLASHRSYLAGRELVSLIRERGVYIERADIPLRAFAQGCGIGTVGRNGLLSIPPYGSRIVLGAFACGLSPRPFTPPPPDPCPKGCVCCSACPVGAVDGGLDVRRCMRLYMDHAARPEWVMEAQEWYLGCEGCLFNCPKNAGLDTNVPGEEAREAFDTKRLITGDCAQARALVGRNMTGGGKLSAEAIVFAAREGKFFEEIRAASADSPFEAVRNAAKWALGRYF